MIVEMILNPIFAITSGLISLIPEPALMPNWLSYTINLLKVPLSIFPIDVWISVIGSVVSWFGIQLGWACVEWIYKKIPGIN